MPFEMEMDDLDKKLNEVFDGKVVRKDLLHRIKKGTNVPTFVLEFCRENYARFGGAAQHFFGHHLASPGHDSRDADVRHGKRALQTAQLDLNELKPVLGNSLGLHAVTAKEHDLAARDPVCHQSVGHR